MCFNLATHCLHIPCQDALRKRVGMSAAAAVENARPYMENFGDERRPKLQQSTSAEDL